MEEVAKKRGRPIGYNKKTISEKKCECCDRDLAVGILKKEVQSLRTNNSLIEKKVEQLNKDLNTLKESSHILYQEASESKTFCRTVRAWLVKKGLLNPLE